MPEDALHSPGDPQPTKVDPGNGWRRNGVPFGCISADPVAASLRPFPVEGFEESTPGMLVEPHWTLITQSAPWPPRDSPGAVVFRDRMWLLGGFQCDISGNFSRLNDIWSSPDGVGWDQILPAAPWRPRNLAGCVVYRDRIWLMGGFDGARTLSDIWSSPDGRHWDQVAAEVPWGARGALGCIVFGDRIWVIGGVNWERKDHYADVWSSSDGTAWEQVVQDADWGPRAMFPALVRDDAIWLLGGGIYHDRDQTHNDIWKSSDGVAWQQITNNADWAPRRFHRAIAYSGALWVMGGADAGSVNLNDVWHSTNGVEWTLADHHAPWAIRHEFGLLESRDKVWLLGGFSGEIAGNAIHNDVWTMTAMD